MSALHLMSQTYRNVPGPGGKTPAELFHGRALRLELSLLLPEPDPEKPDRAAQVNRFDKRNHTA